MTFRVASRSRPGEHYEVSRGEDGRWRCSCAAASFGRRCRHLEVAMQEAGMVGFAEATTTVERLAHGLGAAEVDRLLERVAAHEEAERLRAVLVKVGAAALLGRASRKPAFRTTTRG